MWCDLGNCASSLNNDNFGEKQKDMPDLEGTRRLMGIFETKKKKGIFSLASKMMDYGDYVKCSNTSTSAATFIKQLNWAV